MRAVLDDRLKVIQGEHWMGSGYQGYSDVPPGRC